MKQEGILRAVTEDNTMAKTLIAFFSRADENYFGGAMRYVKIGKEISDEEMR